MRATFPKHVERDVSWVHSLLGKHGLVSLVDHDACVPDNPYKDFDIESLFAPPHPSDKLDCLLEAARKEVPQRLMSVMRPYVPSSDLVPSIEVLLRPPPKSDKVGVLFCPLCFELCALCPKMLQPRHIISMVFSPFMF